MRGSEESGGCANDLEEDAAVMPSGMGLEVRIDGLREQEARRCNERKAVDQELCETGGGGGGGDERGAEEEQAGRVVSRGGRGGGEESEARLQRRLVRGRLEQGRRRRRRRAEEGDAASARPSARRSGLQRCVLEMSTRFCALPSPLAAFSYFQGVYMTIVKVRN